MVSPSLLLLIIDACAQNGNVGQHHTFPLLSICLVWYLWTQLCRFYTSDGWFSCLSLFVSLVELFSLQKLDILIWWSCVITFRMSNNWFICCFFCGLSSQVCECMCIRIKTRLNVWSCLFRIYLRTPLLISWLSDACIVALRHMRAVLSSFQKQE